MMLPLRILSNCCSPVDDNQGLYNMNQRDFSISYVALAKRYHPDRNPHSAALMANIDAARAAILNSYRSSAP
jgi:hypothetical protein